jgi:hypothetical protein
MRFKLPILVSLFIAISGFVILPTPKKNVSTPSCHPYKKSIKPARSWQLSDTLVETSGLIYWENHLYTHNDDTDNALYQLSLNGRIIRRIPLGKTKNVDWEDLAQDKDFIYMGDFGNNSNGQRIDLKILRIEKSTLSTTPIIDTIWFDYENRSISSDKTPNATDFDCEAFVIVGDSMYLFTKEWISNQTTVYALPKIPGKYRAIKKSSHPVDGLITGADMVEIDHKNVLVLCGYSKLLQPFLFVCYNFDQTDFFGGCMQRMNIKLNFHQIEGIAISPLGLYMSNEYFKKGFQTPAKLHFFNFQIGETSKRGLKTAR